MSENDVNDTTDESTHSDDPSDEQAGSEGFLSSITGYFSGDDSDDSDTQSRSPADTESGEDTQFGGPQTGSADEPASGGEPGIEDSTAEIPQAEPADDEFADPAGDDESVGEEEEQAFTDLIGGEEDGQTAEADQSVEGTETTATATGDAAGGEALREGLDDVPDPRESPADVESEDVADDEEPMSESEEESEDPFAEMEGAFDEMDVESVEPDEVWTDVSEAKQQTPAQEGAERMYAEVSKHAFCETCEHFSPPPEAHCNHDGTEIVEFTDMENVRVVDCPIVAERRGLEEGMHSAFDDTDEEPEALEMDDVGELEE